MDCKWTCCPPQCNSCGWRTLRMCDVHKLICVGGYLKKDFHVHHAKAASCSFHLYFVYLEFLYHPPTHFPSYSRRLLCTANAIVGTEFRSAQMETVNHVLYLSTGSYSQSVRVSDCLSVRSSVLRCSLLLRCLLSCLVLVSKFCNFFARLKTNSLKRVSASQECTHLRG